MSNNIINTIITLRKDTAANWTTANTILLAGEIGIETDTNRIKIGNGTSTWNALSYFSGYNTALVPSGGTTDQLLAKNSNTNYDLKWISRPSVAINYTVSVPANGWSASAPYTQTVTVTGMLSTDTPLVDVVLSDTTATALAQLKAYGAISKIVTDTNAITLTCLEDLPSTDLTILLKVVR